MNDFKTVQSAASEATIGLDELRALVLRVDPTARIYNTIHDEIQIDCAAEFQSQIAELLVSYKVSPAPAPRLKTPSATGRIRVSRMSPDEIAEIKSTYYKAFPLTATDEDD